MNEENNYFFRKLVIAFVLYKPTIEVKKIKMFLDKNIDVYVFENSKSNLNLKDKNLYILGNQTNRRTWCSTKKIEIKASDNFKEFIFYLDQDTHINKEFSRF